MAQQIPNFCTQEYLNLSLADVLDQNFDNSRAFWRSIQVFFMTFVGCGSANSQLFDQKFQEYFREMKELYMYTPTGGLTLLNQLRSSMPQHRTNLTVGIIRAKGLNGCTGLTAQIDVDQNHSNQIPLRMNSEIQNVGFDVRASFNKIAQWRRDNSLIQIRVSAQSWINQTIDPTTGQMTAQMPLNDFSIRFQEISAEGFEDWFDFGRGLKLLIKIQFMVIREPNADPTYTSRFHLNTIHKMVLTRLSKFETQNTIDKMHRFNASKTRVGYQRKRVNMGSEQSYWSTPRSLATLLQQINAQRGGIDNVIDKFVKYTDIQLSVFFEDHYEDSVCLCSEFCNWNAFFYFNPIYRCLMVNHAQLYMENKTNIPEMYLAATCGILPICQLAKNSGQPIPKAPILQLIKSANYYRSLNSQTYYLKFQNWRTFYQTSDPPYHYIIGASYKQLRGFDIIPTLIMQSAVDPFSDICIENLIDYYDVLTNLNTAVGSCRQFVTQRQVRYWYKEFDRMGRMVYHEYLLDSIQHKMNLLVIDYDFIFSEDYEYSDVFVENEGKEIKSKRDSIYRFGSPQNPLNMRITLSPIVSNYKSVYKFFRKVDPRLASPRGESLSYIYDCCQSYDNQLTAWSTNPQTTFYFFTSLEEGGQIPANQLQDYKRYYVFYTLKLYLMAFGIQRKCIQSLINYNANEHPPTMSQQVCKEYNFIWQHEPIESKFRLLYQEQLYTVSQNIEDFVVDFYITFWRRSYHENIPPQTLHPSHLPGCMSSLVSQYRRVYFWSRNNGDNRLKFTAIITTFDQIQAEVVNTTHNILLTYIYEAIHSIDSYPNKIEVFDCLAYYLTKAFCSMILNTTATFLKSLHELQLEHLCVNFMSYTLCKPGWVPLFRTMRGVFDKLDQIRNQFIVFEDENNRIDNSLVQTRVLIKDIYRQFYKKLLYEWMNELFVAYNTQVPQAVQVGGIFLIFHTISGLSFLSAFIDDFRMSSRFYRKSLAVITSSPTHPNFPQRAILANVQGGVTAYLRNPNAINDARPFLANEWQNRFRYLFQNFNRDTPNDVVIDMNVADIHI